MAERRFFPAVCLQFSFGCTLCTLVYMMSLNSGDVGRCFPLILLPYAPGVLAVNWLFLKRERSARGVVLLNVCLGLAAFAAVILADGLNSFALLVFAGSFLIWATARGANSAIRQPGLHSQILVLDASALLLVLFTGFLSIMELPIYWGIPIMVGFAAAVLGVITLRMNRAMGVREWTFIGMAFVVLVFFGWLLMSTVAAPAGQGIVAVWNGVVAVCRMIGRALWAFLIFLGSLMEPADYENTELFEPFGIPEMQENLAQANQVVVVVLAVVGVIVAAALVVWGLYLLGKLRIGGIKAEGAKNGPVRRRSSLLQGLRCLFGQWVRMIRVRMFLWKNRAKPIGLYYILIRKCRFGPWHKQPGETPREFLTRLMGYAGEDQRLAGALEELIPAVDAALYAPKGEQDCVPEARIIRRKINAVVRRQSVRICLDNLQAAVRKKPGSGTG